ncbi:hypothetical protein CCDG5_1067 [[Clostridium] cellulosi]|uniref:DUF1540 domain-containing protein n=1 Tax=[Clostridium] cellulosi TaxID=29343 RepID=A0A078KSR7_9FIRM|nr:hypothetical protein CCDG5_1067 [[Clostridium] cellulosi]
MSFVHCSCDCKYQKDGYCNLEKASEITNVRKKDGCLFYVSSSERKNEGYSMKY